MKLQFKGKEQVTNGVITFVFQPDEPVNWQPGQYFHYVLPHESEDDRGVERWFTNSSAPHENRITISTRIDTEKGSSFKKALLALNPGDQIEADGPEGDFTVTDTERNYLFVAGGIGITPFRSILKEAAFNGTNLKVTLLYANRDDNIPFKTELEQIAAGNPNFNIHYVTSPDRIDAAKIRQFADNLDNPTVYLSGPEPMVKSLAAELKDTGFPEESVKLDDFPGYESI